MPHDNKNHPKALYIEKLWPYKMIKKKQLLPRNIIYAAVCFIQQTEYILFKCLEEEYEDSEISSHNYQRCLTTSRLFSKIAA